MQDTTSLLNKPKVGRRGAGAESLHLIDDEPDDEPDQELVWDEPDAKHTNYRASRINLPSIDQLKSIEITINNELADKLSIVESIQPVPSDAELENDSQFKTFSDRCFDQFARGIPFIFIFFGITLMICYVIGFADHKQQSTLIWVMIVLLFFGGLLGMITVFKYGVIGDSIIDLKYASLEYESEITKLNYQNDRMKRNVKKMNLRITDLKHDAIMLAQQAEKFEGLVEQLQHLDSNEKESLKILEKTARIFRDLRKVLLENERAFFLVTFYDCAFRDDDDKMDKNEYKRFLARLSPKQRVKFKKIGTFDELCDESGDIDIIKFQDIIERVLEDIDEMLRQEFQRETYKKKKR